MWNRVRIVHLFRRKRGQMPTPLIGFEQDFVRQHIELFLHLSLHVLGARRPQHAAERALADRDRDRLACARDDFDQQAQVGVDVMLVALFLDQELGQRYGFRGFAGRFHRWKFRQWARCALSRLPNTSARGNRSHRGMHY
jgi:hypothetical protein